MYLLAWRTKQKNCQTSQKAPLGILKLLAENNKPFLDPVLWCLNI